MHKTEIDWTYFDKRLTTKTFGDLTIAYFDGVPVKLSDYAIQVVFARWLWEYPELGNVWGTDELFKILHAQSQMEEEILNSTFSKRQRAMAITDMEILEANGVDLFKEIKFVVNDLDYI